MLTIRQIERMWMTKSYDQMVRLFLEMRPEQSVRLTLELSKSLPAAALAVIRLDELGQSYAPFCGKLLRTILAAQEADGGWGEPMTTALCVRALTCSNGAGPAIDRGIDYFANLQKPEGLFPRIPLRRMPADPFVSAFILLQLGDEPRFQHSIRVGDAINWFDSNRENLDLETAKLWRSLSLRLQVATSSVEEAWS